LPYRITVRQLIHQLQAVAPDLPACGGYPGVSGPGADCGPGECRQWRRKPGVRGRRNRV